MCLEYHKVFSLQENCHFATFQLRPLKITVAVCFILWSLRRFMQQFRQLSQCFVPKGGKFFTLAPNENRILYYQKILNPKKKNWTSRQTKQNTLLKGKILLKRKNPFIAASPFSFIAGLSFAFRQSQPLLQLQIRN
jgi:hypothetical protein